MKTKNKIVKNKTVKSKTPLVCSLIIATLATGLSGVETHSRPSQFQFLIGDWDLEFTSYHPRTGEVKDKKKASQHAVWLNNKSMVFDEWTSFAANGETSSHGVTLRVFSEKTKTWQNVWVNSAYPEETSPFESEQRGGEMHGHGQYEHPVAGTVHFKLRFFDISPDSYRWEQKISLDGGKTWLMEKSYRAKRRR